MDALVFVIHCLARARHRPSIPFQPSHSLPIRRPKTAIIIELTPRTLARVGLKLINMRARLFASFCVNTFITPRVCLSNYIWNEIRTNEQNKNKIEINMMCLRALDVVYTLLYRFARLPGPGIYAFIWAILFWLAVQLSLSNLVRIGAKMQLGRVKLGLLAANYWPEVASMNF